MDRSQSSISQKAQLQSDLKLKSISRLPSESSETMHKGLEVSLGSFRAKGLFYGPSSPRGFTGQSLDLKYSIGGKQAIIDFESDGEVSSEKLTVPSECRGTSVRQENYFLKNVHSQSYPLDGCIYPTNNVSYFQMHPLPQVPLQMVPQSYSPNYVFQDFQYFVVIDFEATCDKENKPHPQEIIEFPSVIVNISTGQLEDCFQIYVRPTYYQLLTDFCKELTGIQQSQVDNGVLLSDALLMHDKWLEDKGIKNTNFAIVTWSNWDCKVLLESECRFKRIRKPPYFNRWINLKIPFNNLYGSVRRTLREAVELAGLTWEGRAHSGLDDAKNTARLLVHLLHCGFKFSITNSIQGQYADHSNTYQPQPQPQPQPQQQIPSAESDLDCQSHKWKTSPFLPYTPYQPLQAANHSNEPSIYCFCGVKSFKRVYQILRSKLVSHLFECGNWTPDRGPACSFRKWTYSASDSAKPAWK